MIKVKTTSAGHADLLIDGELVGQRADRLRAAVDSRSRAQTDAERDAAHRALWAEYRSYGAFVEENLDHALTPHEAKEAAHKAVLGLFSSAALTGVAYSVADEVFKARVARQTEADEDTVRDALDTVIDILGREEVLYVRRGQHGVDADGDDGSDEPNKNDEVAVERLRSLLSVARDVLGA